MELVRHAFSAMGCPCELQLYADEPAARAALDAALAEIARLDRKYSSYRDDSLAAEIARSAGKPGGIEVDPETAALLDYAHECHVQSGGLFDITAGALRRAWRLQSGQLPSRRELAAARRLVGWRRVRWERPRLILPRPGMDLDFGGYVKEYAVDRVAGLLAERGIQHGLVDLGGDLRALGPHPDGKPWTVGIRNPRARDSALRVIGLGSGALATSGSYERFMLIDGVRYSHILNPLTGWPIPEGLESVSVLAQTCLIAGTATTIAMLLGSQNGPQWLSELGLPSLTLDTHGELAGSLS